jgi:peptidoglycan/xylan/chitin deacetylase (PgdA/CDA1 family)
MPPLLSVSVDLDEVGCYHAIHGLDGRPGAASRAVWDRAVPRFLELFDELGLRATFFVVGSDLDQELGVPRAREMAAVGHELANHSHDHRYDLLRLGPAARRDQVVRAAEAIGEATGMPPRGFRAPGYNIDDDLARLLVELGYGYDSSVFACPPYYAAKAAALAAIRLRGRRSRSLLGPPTVMAAPAEPYRMGSGFWRRGRGAEGDIGLIELPVALLPGLRVPFIGTTLTMAGVQASRLMGRAMRRRRFVGLELHGIDLLDHRDPGLDELVGHQPDLTIPRTGKAAAITAAVTELKKGGALALTSHEAAAASISF